MNQIISKVNLRLNTSMEIFKYAKYQTNKMITTIIILSVFRYALPLLIDSTHAQLKTLQLLLLKYTRPILGFRSYKMNTMEILDELKWPTIYQLIEIESVKFVHKINFEKLLLSLANYFHCSERTELVRSCWKLRNKNDPIDSNMSKSVLYRSVYIYNLIDDLIKSKNPKLFNKDIQQYFRNFMLPFENPKT